MKTTAIQSIREKPLTASEVADRIYAYSQATAPFMKFAADIYALSIPRYIIHADGSFEKIDDGLTPNQMELIEECKRQMLAAANSFGLIPHDNTSDR